MKYKVTKEGKEKFQTNLTRLAEHKFSNILNAASPETLDNILCIQAPTKPDIEKSVEVFYEILENACRISSGHKDDKNKQNSLPVVFRTHNNAKKVECA